MFRLAKILILIFLVAPNRSSAQTEAIITDRPDQTESPFTVPRQHFQMETGLIFEKADKETKSFVLPTILFKYGLTDYFDLRLITDFSATKSGNETVSGLNPLTVGFKVNISKEKGIIPTTSFIGALTIPKLATEKLKGTYYAPAFRFTMQHTLNRKLFLGYNLGAEWDGEKADAVFVYTLTTDYNVTDKITSYIELYGFLQEGSNPDHRFDGGVTYLVKPNILIDFSGGFGITTNAPDYYTSIGFSFRLRD